MGRERGTETKFLEFFGQQFFRSKVTCHGNGDVIRCMLMFQLAA